MLVSVQKEVSPPLLPLANACTEMVQSPNSTSVVHRAQLSSGAHERRTALCF